MISLSFPDVSIWLSLVVGEHTGHGRALAWWNSEERKIGLCRITQLGLLRLLTTGAVMNGRPLTMEAAWQVQDRVGEDGRVVWLEEPGGFEVELRREAGAATGSPKVWADAYLVAMARRAGAQLVTMDRALAARGCGALLA